MNKIEWTPGELAQIDEMTRSIVSGEFSREKFELYRARTAAEVPVTRNPHYLDNLHRSLAAFDVVAANLAQQVTA